MEVIILLLLLAGAVTIYFFDVKKKKPEIKKPSKKIIKDIPEEKQISRSEIKKLLKKKK
jgi:hypothetical protein